eukprot:CAMPEP_0114510380 /NCGR_PEP_ID=MMETSP0109-20121206/13753_1 /TAXON_ID=29199 /ORGANISM="Chlorarachnion reptans, Strain CCCM449" /LENGTH=622 /DNA_ID=CAMNT_0001689677 /DNA_START=331 /DNA_END=2199 /DNA_ORIENTATION=+
MVSSPSADGTEDIKNTIVSESEDSVGEISGGNQNVTYYRQVSGADALRTRRKKIKAVASAMDIKDISNKLKPNKKRIPTSHSMPNMRDPLRSLMRSVPFYAIHGMGAHVRAMSRSMSRESFSYTEDEEPLITKALEQQACTSRLTIVVFSVLMGAINFGYNTSVLNTPEEVIRESLAGRRVDDFSWAIIVSIFSIGGLVGSWVAPPLLDTIGRKSFMLFNGIFLTLVLLLEAMASSVAMMAFARLMIGASCGGTTVAVPLYLGEIAPVTLRGALGTLNQFAMVVGILLAQVLGGGMFGWKGLGYDPGWRYLLAIGAVFSTLQVLLSCFVVESPRWLVMQNRKVEAKRILKMLRGIGPNEDSAIIMIELESMEEVAQEEKREVSVGSLVRNPRNRFPFMIGVMLMIFQQFSGINAVFYYSTSFFKKANFADPYLGTVLCGSVNVLATLVAVDLMDRAGRKALLVLSSVGMTISSIILTVSLVASANFNLELGYLEVLGVLTYVTFFEFGLGPIPWAITAELFGAVERATAMGACSCINWIACFVIGLTFPGMSEFLGSYSFVPFALITMFSAFFSYSYVPETKGRSLKEIQDEMFRASNRPRAGTNRRAESMPEDSEMQVNYY